MTSFSTIAASFTNGSRVPLAKVDGDRSYRDLVHWLAVDPRDFVPSTNGAPLKTSRVVLDEMLCSLVTAGSERLGEPIRAAAISLPCHGRVHHYYDVSIEPILRDSFSVVGIEYIRTFSHSIWGEPLTYPENTIAAGHGLGLCEPYYNTSISCIKAIPDDTYLLVGYYDNALELTRPYDKVVYSGWAWLYPLWHLGRDARYKGSFGTSSSGPDDAYYWEQVRQQLIKVIPPSWHNNISKVITYGPYGDDPRLHQEVMSILEHFSDNATWVDDGVDGVFAGALGTAELLKRKPYWDRLGKNSSAGHVMPYQPIQQILA